MTTALVLVLALVMTVSCTQHRYEGKYSMTSDEVLWTFDKRVPLYATALMEASGGWLVLWTDEQGAWSLLVDREGNAKREPELLVSAWSARMAATDLGGVCKPLGARYAVAVAPRVSVLDGSAPLLVLLLDETGSTLGKLTLDSAVGPYSSGVDLLGSCDGLLVGWHRGGIGEFTTRLAGVDVRNITKLHDTVISEPGKNGFCPELIRVGDETHVFWGEVRVKMKDRAEDEDLAGQIMHARIDPTGQVVSGPHAVLETHRCSVPPSVIRLDSGMAILYKDHPGDEYREGIYLGFLAPNGSLQGATTRIARGDGPDPAELHVMPEGRLATTAVRSLSNELLIGLNFLDEKGSKRSGEVQIYAHQVRFRRLATLTRGENLVLLYVEQRKHSTRLLLSTVSPVS